MHPAAHRILAERVGFGEWVQTILTDAAYEMPLWGPCTDLTEWILSEDGEQIVDYVGRFDDYQRSLGHIFGVLDKAELTGQIQRTNRSIHKPTREYYVRRTMETVERRYCREVTHFGFRFR